MSDAVLGRQILWLTLYLIAGFGGLVGVWSVVAWRRGESARMLWVRYLAWFAIIPPLLLPLVFSRHAFQAVVLLLSLLAFTEYHRVTGLWRDRGLVAACYLGILAIFAPIFFDWYGLFQAIPVYAIGLILLIPIFRDQFEHMIQKVCLSALGILYFGWFLAHLAYLRNHQAGIALVFFLLVLVESNDAFGYLWGKLLGRHKLAPRISPNKTIEGALGGLVSVIALGWLLHPLLPWISTPHILLVSACIAVFGLCGDLVISYIKRDLQIKDIGNIIPGHGGLLDRFDSLLFAVPIFFHLIRYFYGHFYEIFR